MTRIKEEEVGGRRARRGREYSDEDKGENSQKVKVYERVDQTLAKVDRW